MSRRSKSAAEPSGPSNHAGGSMRPLAALGLAIILWLPSGRALTSGDLDITNAAIRFLVAVGVCWTGVTIVATIVRGYATQAPPPPAPPKRRRTDQGEAAAGGKSTTTPNFAAVEMHPEHGNDDAIIDIVSEDA